jgi:GDP-4-dehydro-6-deoxy-D-mannose reductase
VIERVLITGVTGFVGTWMARYFKKSLPNCELWGTSFQSTAGPSGLDHFVQLDLRDKRSTYSLIEKCVPDRVVHLAGLIGNASLDDLISVNIIGTENLYQSLTELCNLDRLRVVQASSAAIYGPIELAELPISEEQTPRPITPYAISKLTQEYLALSFYRREGLQVILGRVFNILGPGQPRGLVPMTFIEEFER